MAPKPTLLEDLADCALRSRPQEITCDEWIERVGPYVEALARGGEIPAALDVVAHHTEICPQCAEEFEALRDALGLSGSSR